MKYKQPHIVKRLKEWLEDPHRCSADKLPHQLDYLAAQHLGPALMRLKEKPLEERTSAIKKESRKCKHLSVKCLHFLAHQIFDEQQEPGPISMTRKSLEAALIKLNTLECLGKTQVEKLTGLHQK